MSAAATVHRCTGCGARVVLDGPALSTACSYCDSPLVDDARAGASFDLVVPFHVPQRAAVERLRAHLDERRWWVPKPLRAIRIHPRAVRGVLVPFWVYEGVVRSDYRAKIGIHWYRTETTTDPAGQRRTKRVRETEWFPLRGSAVCQIEDHLVSASVGLAESEAGALAPYDLGWSTSYDPRLLSGFEAELATVVERDAGEVANDALRRAEPARIRGELLPGDVNRLDWIASQVELHSPRLALLPVWIATHRQGDLVLRLLVNGQTGRVSGRLPISKARIAAVVLGVLALVAVIALIIWRIGARS